MKKIYFYLTADDKPYESVYENYTPLVENNSFIIGMRDDLELGGVIKNVTLSSDYFTLTYRNVRLLKKYEEDNIIFYHLSYAPTC